MAKKTASLIAETAPQTFYIHPSGIRVAHNVFTPPSKGPDYPTVQNTIVGMGASVSDHLKTFAGTSLLERTGFFYDDSLIFPDEQTHPLELADLKTLDRIQLRELYNYKSAQIAQYNKDIAEGIERPDVIVKSENDDNGGNQNDQGGQE